MGRYPFLSIGYLFFYVILRLVVVDMSGIDAKVLNQKDGTGSRTRTGTVSPPPDFESGASTNFAIPACERRFKGHENTLVAEENQ